MLSSPSDLTNVFTISWPLHWVRLLQDVVRVRSHLDDGVRVGPHLYDDLDVTKNKVGKNRLVNHHNNNKFTKNLAYFQVPSKHLHLKKRVITIFSKSSCIHYIDIWNNKNASVNHKLQPTCPRNLFFKEVIYIVLNLIQLYDPPPTFNLISIKILYYVITILLEIIRTTDRARASS